MAFEHVVTVRFQDVDRAGIAFFGKVFDYCHATYEELLVALGRPIASLFEAGGFGMPLVHTEADFSRPMQLGDRLRVSVVVSEVSERTMTFDYTLRGADDGELRATARLVHVFVDLQRFRARLVPEDLVRDLDQLGVLTARQEPTRGSA